MRTFAFAFRDRLEFLEQFDLFFVITDLQVPVINDDRPLQYGRIFDDKVTQFIQRHLIDIDLVFLDDLGTFGDDIIRSVLCPGNEILDFLLVEKRIENVLLNEAKMIVFQIILDFTAGRTSWRSIYDYHASIITPISLILSGRMYYHIYRKK